MASFKEEVQPVTPPRSINDSRGVPTNRAFETLFSGLGKTISQAANNAEVAITADIENTLSGAVEEAAGSGGGIPQDIINSEKDLKRVANARNQGTISDSEFIQRVDPTLSRLRSRYPGFSKEIDAAYSRATGRSSANALRKAQLREAKENQRIFEKERTRRDKMVDRASKAGVPNPQLLDEDTLVIETNKKDVLKANTEAAIAEMSLMDKDKKLRKERVKEFAINEVNNVWQTVFEKVQSDGKFDPSSPVGKMANIIKNANQSAADGLTPEEITELRRELNELKLATAQAAQQIMLTNVNGKSLSSHLADPAAEKEIAGILEQRIAAFEEAIVSGDVPLLKANEVLQQAQDDQAVQLVRKEMPELTSIKAVTQHIGQQAWAEAQLEVFKLVGKRDMTKRMASAAMAMATQTQINIAGGEKDAFAKSLDTLGLTGGDAGAHVATIESVAASLGNVNSSAAYITDTINNNFSDRLLASLNQYDANQRQLVLSRLINPSITANVKKASVNSPELLNKYDNFIKQGFKLLYEGDVRLVMEGITDAQNLDVQWNPKTFQFDVKPKVGAQLPNITPDALVFGSLEFFKNFRDESGITRVNQFLKRWGAVQLARGETPESASNNLMELLKTTVPEFDRDAEKKGPIFMEFLNSIVNAVGGGSLDKDLAKAGEKVDINIPSDVQITPTAGPPPPTGDPFVDNGSRLMTDLQRDLGLTPEQAAGFVGNLATETGGFKHFQEIKPLVPGSKGGFGFAQWTGPRRRAFEAWVEESGLDPRSYEANYGFLLHELQNTPEGRVLKSLTQARTAEEASDIVSDKFLRPGIKNRSSRQKFTQQALAL